MSDVRFTIWERDGYLQLDVGDDMGGYRLLGPKFAGDSRRLHRGRTLSVRDVEEIRRYLDKVDSDE